MTNLDKLTRILMKAGVTWNPRVLASNLLKQGVTVKSDEESLVLVVPFSGVCKAIEVVKDDKTED